jgi:hypothetical protein
MGPTPVNIDHALTPILARPKCYDPDSNYLHANQTVKEPPFGKRNHVRDDDRCAGCNASTTETLNNYNARFISVLTRPECSIPLPPMRSDMLLAEPHSALPAAMRISDASMTGRRPRILDAYQPFTFCSERDRIPQQDYH